MFWVKWISLPGQGHTESLSYTAQVSMNVAGKLCA